MKNGKDIAPPAARTIRLQRQLSLPVSTVWKAWSEPDTFKKWWGPKDFTCPDCRIDFKVGGKIHASMQDKDGRKFWSIGTYREIEPRKRFVVTDNFADEKGNIVSANEAGLPGEWPDEVLLTVELNEADGGTQMNLTHEGIPAGMYDDCIQGWSESLDKMEKIGK